MMTSFNLVGYLPSTALKFVMKATTTTTETETTAATRTTIFVTCGLMTSQIEAKHGLWMKRANCSQDF